MALDVSVIIPTYNRADLIGYTLRSIVDQTHKPAEIIVVDDGSTDDTESVVKAFGYGVRYIRIQNSGECTARNVGVSKTSAPWVAFCDSDDLWRPRKLEMHARLVGRRPELLYSFSNFSTVVNDKWSASTKFDSSPPRYWNLSRGEVGDGSFVVEESMFERLLVHQPIFPSTLVMHRRFFESVGRWRDSLGRTPSVDLEFHLRCVGHPPIGVIAAPVAGIRKHGSNFSGDTLRTTIGEVEVLRLVLEQNPDASRHADAIRRQIVLRSASAASGAFAIGKAELGRKLLEAIPYCERSWKLHVKSMIAHLPPALRCAFQRA